MTKIGDGVLPVALRDDDVARAVVSYQAIRHALVLPDDMGTYALAQLRDRVIEAAGKYGDAEGTANAKMKTVLTAYASYLSACMWERQ